MAECHRQHAASVRSPEIACANIPSRQRKSPIKLMPFTTREIESPDPVTRVAAADAALREPGQDDIGEKMVLNMGPSHPATHGVLRLPLGDSITGPGHASSRSRRRIARTGAGRYRREDGAQHGAVAPCHARRFAAPGGHVLGAYYHHD